MNPLLPWAFSSGPTGSCSTEHFKRHVICSQFELAHLAPGLMNRSASQLSAAWAPLQGVCLSSTCIPQLRGFQQDVGTVWDFHLNNTRQWSGHSCMSYLRGPPRAEMGRRTNVPPWHPSISHLTFGPEAQSRGLLSQISLLSWVCSGF